MEIRGHHLLCMRYFKGKGYNDEFVHNFFDVKEKIGEVKVTTRPGMICSACPHNKGVCTKEPDAEIKMKEHDKRVLNFFGFKVGDVVDFNSTLSKPVSKQDIKSLCVDCQWMEHCGE